MVVTVDGRRKHINNMRRAGTTFKLGSELDKVYCQSHYGIVRIEWSPMTVRKTEQ